MNRVFLLGLLFQACAESPTAERCDGIDDDGDGDVDEGEAVGASVWHRDADGDGYGDPEATVARCVQPAGYVADGTDADDARANVLGGVARSWR